MSEYAFDNIEQCCRDEYESPINITFPATASFLTENPGLQSHTGSFEPIKMTWAQWSSSVIHEVQAVNSEEKELEVSGPLTQKE